MSWETVGVLAMFAVPLAGVLVWVAFGVVVLRYLRVLVAAQDATTEAVNEGARDVYGVLHEIGHDVSRLGDEEQPGSQGEHPGSTW